MITSVSLPFRKQQKRIKCPNTFSHLKQTRHYRIMFLKLKTQFLKNYILSIYMSLQFNYEVQVMNDSFVCKLFCLYVAKCLACHKIYNVTVDILQPKLSSYVN